MSVTSILQLLAMWLPIPGLIGVLIDEKYVVSLKSLPKSCEFRPL